MSEVNNEESPKLPEEEPKGLFEQKTLSELGTEFVRVTDDMVQRRTKAIEEVMTEEGYSITEAFENPDTEAGEVYKFLEDEFIQDESTTAKAFLGWTEDPNRKDADFVVMSPGVVFFSFPFQNQAEGKAMFRHEIYHTNPEGEIESISIEQDAGVEFEDLLTGESWDKLQEQKEAGVNFVPLDLKRADSIVHALKVAKRWIGKDLYGIEPQPGEPA